MSKDRKEFPQNISIQRYTHESQPSYTQVEQAAEAYIKVFVGYPWFEVNRCHNCEHFFGPENKLGEICPGCNIGVLEEAYTKEGVITTISQLFEKPGAGAYLLKNDGRVEGFAWGSLKTLNDYGPKFENSLWPFVANQLSEELLTTQRANFYSISEVGLNESLRGIGLGKALLENILKDASSLETVATVWTRKDTVLTPICLKAGFKQVFGPEVFVRSGEVIETGRILVGLDKVTPERVFFIKG